MKQKSGSWRLVFYIWMALPFLLLVSLHEVSAFDTSLATTLVNNAWRTFYVVIVNIAFFELALALVFRRRQFLLYNLLAAIGVLVVFLFLWSYGLYLWRAAGVAVGVYTPLGDSNGIKHVLPAQMAFSMGAVFFFGIIRHIYKYVKLQQAGQQLRIEKQAAELNFLRAQTNPHFLFNTLNNIYSLSRSKSDRVPESILRLSKILRFMLYETGGDNISIEQELAIIADYIELEKLRYDDSLSINFNYNVEDMKQSIPPLLLVPLVENAFKHGVSETRHRPYVSIHLSVKQRNLLFMVKNSAEASPGKKTANENIGLRNLRRQLELLYHDYNLTDAQEGEEFTATLRLNLASHV